MTGLRVSPMEQGDSYVVALEGELDLASVGELQQVLDRFLTYGHQRLVLDLSRLEFMDSTGLNLIVGAYQRTRDTGHDFALVPGPTAVQRLFEISGLIDVLPF